MEYLFLVGIIAGAYLQEYLPLVGPRTSRLTHGPKGFKVFQLTVVTLISDRFHPVEVTTKTLVKGTTGIHLTMGRLMVLIMYWPKSVLKAWDK